MRCYNCNKSHIAYNKDTQEHVCLNTTLCEKEIDKRKEEISKLDIHVGTKIKFSGDRCWYTCTYKDDKYIIAIRYDKRLGSEPDCYYYTICDIDEGIRGKDNLVLSYWDYSNPEVCKEAIKEFYNGELEISYRNFMELDIIQIKD